MSSVIENIIEDRSKIEDDRIRDQKKLDIAFKNVMRTEDGQKVLSAIVFSFCGAFTTGRYDEFTQGMKHVGLSLLDQMAQSDATSTMQIIDEGYMNDYRRVD